MSSGWSTKKRRSLGFASLSEEAKLAERDAEIERLKAMRRALPPRHYPDIGCIDDD